ncbi:insertion sequence 2 OrfA protein [Klebsiella pneumoniae]|uniref:Insertion sequence 2 OrfA protein n=1 Tax=Klebsiella pneumoniae TaxID=573 RepID=A0A377WZG4_KLEPN|nr:insertion sequence 2 OrfA protein [Klebsiella pneumoniae]STV49294.1 insertion sequence 2 OrfA protein [Klebsiella pneumoniae subsp. rhinoscleromatis]STT72736.1 insertion sequence 2 OrfA protein [Klebsiella pneumoniae]STU49233.1 insertion sequence 2 OrfA protein [Klebsiella pneumoniae]STW14593.1 insertion sequence 2 OrfA protein [Klebsiella pneumoniae subsp. rhinoscleromatis]
MIDVLGPEKRRRRTTQEKIAIVQQSFEPGMTVSLVARQHGVAASCQQRVKSDPLTVTTNGLILIHLVYSGLASAITPAFRFCFSR